MSHHCIFHNHDTCSQINTWQYIATVSYLLCTECIYVLGGVYIYITQTDQTLDHKVHYNKNLTKVKLLLRRTMLVSCSQTDGLTY